MKKHLPTITKNQQMGIVLTLFLSCIILALILLGVQKFEGMQPELILAVATDFIGMGLALSVSVGLLIGENSPRTGSDYFLVFSCCSFLALFFDLLTCLSSRIGLPDFFQTLFYLLSYLLKTVVLLFYLFYVLTFAKKISKTQGILLIVISCIFALVSFIILLSLIRTVSQEGLIYYEEGSTISSHLLMFAGSSVIAISMFYIVIWKNLSRKWRYSLFYYLLSVLGDILLSWFLTRRPSFHGQFLIIPLLYIYCLTCMEFETTDQEVPDTDTGIPSAKDHPQLITPTAVNKDVTVLVCRLHNFGLITEHMNSSMVIAIFNRFAEEMTPIIESNNGLIISFSDYSVYAVFGANDDDSQLHPEAAVRAALEMQQAKLRLNAWCKENHYPTVYMGIAIHSAESIVSAIGANGHMQYAVIYRNVSMTERMERLSNDGDIIVSQSTAYRLKSKLSILDSLEFRHTPRGSAMKIYRIEGLTNE